MQQRDTLVMDRPTEVIGDPAAGRHRAAPSAGRRVLTRIAVSAVALLGVAVLGWLTADAVGLTRAEATSAADLPPGSLRPAEEEPRPGRTVDITTRPTSAPVQPPPPVGAGGPAPEVGTASPARPAQARAEPPPVRTVKVGDTCPSPGAVGVTSRGKQALCTAGGGPTRWKHA